MKCDTHSLNQHCKETPVWNAWVAFEGMEELVQKRFRYCNRCLQLLKHYEHYGIVVVRAERMTDFEPWTPEVNV
jgi:hypothetical protein